MYRQSVGKNAQGGQLHRQRLYIRNCAEEGANGAIVGVIAFVVEVGGTLVMGGFAGGCVMVGVVPK